ncbi:copper-transporting ATPase PAA1, chloroplastic [Artemisia annua]|uniref:Copper-transporting ATPase PAA1, chloroplastic n=1 Tax=Artemisia annua TaxID=35608 RepID=A0A2U1MYX5_ARTAN|nr:copper-transporting ATPase PAA1, chloroplastic [Artemisia annua]
MSAALSPAAAVARGQLRRSVRLFGGGGGVAGGSWNSPVDVSAFSSDVIILDVRGMTCGGCSASVKRILESQPLVSSASVNLTTETAIVWPVSEAKVKPNWQKVLGEELAKHLTNCGFNSNVRDSKKESAFQTFQRKVEEKRKQLKESGRGLAVSWALCAVCLFGHVSHFIGAKAWWIHAMHSTGFHMSLSLFTLLVPGRQLIVDGMKSLLRGTPNMNTLVGLGAISSFTVSSLAALIPKLGWKVFFEEPIMLIAFVLLGRNLEQRAKIKATSDMTGLLSVLPPKARLLVNHDDGQESNSTVDVPCDSLSVGDQIVVLPGDRVPADGIVRAGRSAVDESSFTGEPLPVTKLPGAEVSAGSINLNGALTVEVRRPGGETFMGDIVRLVEEAQSREAPVQRLADKVAGHFTYGVMAISAATFMFWSTFGARILPVTLQHGSAMSLALQLSCSVLVVACPCALGLATPTAVLVGTSLGATKGLLLRGGSILEKFAAVNTVVFDKTGTLTIGKPVVTKILTTISDEFSELNSDEKWSETDVLKLAAAVESNTIHPIGKAILEAARSAKCPNLKADDGTFMEEPGSGAVASIGKKIVSVGSLEWVFYGVKPDEKNKFINKLQKDRHVVAMVGDGINDAAALASSHVGVAIGGGVGAASEVASIVLMGNKISQLIDALELSRQTMTTVKQNLWWAFGYNIVGIPIAAGTLLPLTGLMLTPSIAGALMGLSSIGVMTNSLLLRFRFASHQKKIHGASSSYTIQEDIEAPKTLT